jgi:CRISPR-associated protein Cmr4
MKKQFYKIKTLSNMHVGSGQNSYGIVDNVVQKDYLTELPCINSTSLKGAIREYAKAKKWPNVDDLFGSEPNEKKSDKLKSGSHYFSQANLLSFPMRSDKLQFFNVTCPSLLKELHNMLPNNHNLKTKIETLLKNKAIADLAENIPISDTFDGYIIEKHTIKTRKVDNIFDNELTKVFGENMVVMHNDSFKRIVTKLPIITRNQLENGQSTNLFYEEIVPRESVFGFTLQAETVITSFDDIPEIQIGANATVGYGFCSIKKI